MSTRTHAQINNGGVVGVGVGAGVYGIEGAGVEAGSDEEAGAGADGAEEVEVEVGGVGEVEVDGAEEVEAGGAEEVEVGGVEEVGVHEVCHWAGVPSDLRVCLAYQCTSRCRRSWETGSRKCDALY